MYHQFKSWRLFIDVSKFSTYDTAVCLLPNCQVFVQQSGKHQHKPWSCHRSSSRPEKLHTGRRHKIHNKGWDLRRPDTGWRDLNNKQSTDFKFFSKIYQSLITDNLKNSSDSIISRKKIHLPANYFLVYHLTIVVDGDQPVLFVRSLHSSMACWCTWLSLSQGFGVSVTGSHSSICVAQPLPKSVASWAWQCHQSWRSCNLIYFAVLKSRPLQDRKQDHPKTMHKTSHKQQDEQWQTIALVAVHLNSLWLEFRLEV